jgi:hypothetical protein
MKMGYIYKHGDDSERRNATEEGKHFILSRLYTETLYAGLLLPIENVS